MCAHWQRAWRKVIASAAVCFDRRLGCWLAAHVAFEMACKSLSPWPSARRLIMAFTIKALPSQRALCPHAPILGGPSPKFSGLMKHATVRAVTHGSGMLKGIIGHAFCHNRGALAALASSSSRRLTPCRFLGGEMWAGLRLVRISHVGQWGLCRMMETAARQNSRGRS